MLGKNLLKSPKKQNRRSKMEKSTGNILKTAIPWIIVQLILIAVIEGIFNFMGVSVGVVGSISSNLFYDMDEMFVEGARFGVPLGMSLLSLIVSILASGITSLITFGLHLSLYRYMRYDTPMRFEHLFYFFNENFIINFATAIIYQVILVIGFILFVIPGIIFSLGFFPIAIWLGKYQMSDNSNPIEVLQETWASTKGNKGMIFKKFILFIVIIILVAIVIMAFFGHGVYSMYMGEGGGGSIALAIIFGLILALIFNFIIYVPVIKSYKTLIHQGVFDEPETLY